MHIHIEAMHLHVKDGEGLLTALSGIARQLEEETRREQAGATALTRIQELEASIALRKEKIRKDAEQATSQRDQAAEVNASLLAQALRKSEELLGLLRAFARQQ